jgi:nucleotide-binding universal stress UspA family protein
MIEINTILCPIDFSDYSRRALDHAVAVARWYDSTITAFHVYAAPPPAAYGLESPPPVGMVLTPADRERLTTAMARFVETANASGVPTEIAIGQGTSAANEILQQADAMRADLLTIGTHGRSGFDRFVLGSVAEKVLRRADCPVLTVPRQAPDAVPVAPAVFTRILCPIDFSDSSMHALNYAMSLAQEADASLTVLHVMVYDLEIEAPELYETVIADKRLSVADYRRRCEEYSRERLRAAVPETVGAYCTVEVLLASGKPYREILRVAAEQQTDLIVMGVQGRGAADLMVFGSTTQHVVRQATCPVLTIRKGNPSGSL